MKCLQIRIWWNQQSATSIINGRKRSSDRLYVDPHVYLSSFKSYFDSPSSLSLVRSHIVQKLYNEYRVRSCITNGDTVQEMMGKHSWCVSVFIVWPKAWRTVSVPSWDGDVLNAWAIGILLGVLCSLCQNNLIVLWPGRFLNARCQRPISQRANNTTPFLSFGLL